MAGTKPDSLWRQTQVLLRADIADQARERGIDISNACNQALAGLLGMDYRQQKLDQVPGQKPVIIARDGAGPALPPPLPKTAPRQRPPVINADDPAAAGVITRSRKPGAKPAAPEHPVNTPREEPGPAPAHAPEPPAPAAGRGRRGAKEKTGAPKKSDAIKKFIRARIARDDTADASIPKEELYRVFSRWCREEKIPVPELKAVSVALKTRFAFSDMTIKGISCWTHVRLK